MARAHREAAAALFAAAYPDRADEPAGWDASSGPAGTRRYVAVTGAGRIVGYGGLWPVRRVVAGPAGVSSASIWWWHPPTGGVASVAGCWTGSV
jgi:hypothetical protein